MWSAPFTILKSVCSRPSQTLSLISICHNNNNNNNIMRLGSGYLIGLICHEYVQCNGYKI